MPNFDKTGPKGEGIMTGRKQGNCIDDKTCLNGTRKRCCQNANKNNQNRNRQN